MFRLTKLLVQIPHLHSLATKINDVHGPSDVLVFHSSSTNRLHFITETEGTDGNSYILSTTANDAVTSITAWNGGVTAAETEGMIDDDEAIRKRIPFEALVEPEKYLSNFTLIPNVPETSGSYNATASWDGKGDNLYTKMASNFLAESVDLFLNNSQLTAIVSEEQGSDNFGIAEYGKALYETKMFRTYTRGNTFEPRTQDPDGASAYFGGYIPPQQRKRPRNFNNVF